MSRFPDIALSVVMPAYNEEATVQAAIRRAVASLRAMVGRFEVLLIDDCSTDGTGALAEELGRELPEVRVLKNATNLGQGGSLRRGFAEAKLDLVIHNAIDCPFDFDDLPALLERFPAADVVVAARDAYPGVTPRRRAMSWANRALIRLLFGARLHDYNFVQVYRRELLQRLPCFSRATTFITVERIIRAHWAGYRVEEVVVPYHPRQVGGSSSGTLKHVRRGLTDMARLFVELRLGP